ncbi:MAG: DEAD/DEAH box helicase [Candidatus Omnitrophica bacterium]|nr:DEAD/DEAH box helicase [Candidatus Omnitrophota bacterium]
MTPVHPQSNASFYGLGIAPKILEFLDRMKFTVPTPIQHKAIPAAIEGKDIIGVAQTGTGKTLAFAIPIIQRLAQQKGRCLILVPTRELALQIDETFRNLALLFNMHTAVIIGGVSMHKQLQALRRDPRIFIATPGRLVDHLKQRTIFLNAVSVLVLDEADRMLDLGFLPDIERILKIIPKERQTMLFSATIPKEAIAIAAAHMKLPVHIEVAPSGTAAERITQELFIVKKGSKNELLRKLLNQYRGSVLLFSRTKSGASKIVRFLREAKYSAAEIHANRSLSQRIEALEGFKSGKYRVLVATDIAARGIDVIDIEIVINYDLPEYVENYVHRIGRTGRAGHEGHAISFATPEQWSNVRNIEKLIKTVLPISEHPELPRETFTGKSVQPEKARRKHRFGVSAQRHGTYKPAGGGGSRQQKSRSSVR